jgi:hypothetical protein
MVTALLATYAGLAHLVVAPDHLAVWWPAGAFFVVVGLLQLAYCITAIRRPAPIVIGTTLVVNVGVLLVYVASRSVGVAIGPPSHEPHNLEAVGPFDLSVAIAEVGVVALVAVGLDRRARAAALNSLLVVGLVLWGGLLVLAWT